MSEVFSSNGTSHISETEARLGDLMRDGFPRDGTREGMSRAREMFLDWAKRNGIPFLSFWEYYETKRKHPGIVGVGGTGVGVGTMAETEENINFLDENINLPFFVFRRAGSCFPRT